MSGEDDGNPKSIYIAIIRTVSASRFRNHYTAPALESTCRLECASTAKELDRPHIPALLHTLQCAKIGSGCEKGAMGTVSLFEHQRCKSLVDSEVADNLTE